MARTSPRRPTRRIFCLDCDPARNLDYAGFPSDKESRFTNNLNVIAYDHALFAPNTCTHQNFVVELTRTNGRTSEARYGIFDGRLVRVEV